MATAEQLEADDRNEAQCQLWDVNDEQVGEYAVCVFTFTITDEQWAEAVADGAAAASLVEWLESKRE
jgi:hypothetical protein